MLGFGWVSTDNQGIFGWNPKEGLFNHEDEDVENDVTMFERVFDLYGHTLIDRFAMHRLTKEQHDCIFVNVRDEIVSVINSGSIFDYIRLRAPINNTLYTTRKAVNKYCEVLQEETKELLKNTMIRYINDHVNLDDEDDGECHCSRCTEERENQNGDDRPPKEFLTALTAVAAAIKQKREQEAQG
jgi:hypothetical protein